MENVMRPHDTPLIDAVRHGRADEAAALCGWALSCRTP